MYIKYMYTLICMLQMHIVNNYSMHNEHCFSNVFMLSYDFLDLN